MFQYNILSLFAGSNSPYSPAFESLATQTLQGIQNAQFSLSYPRADVFGWDGAGTPQMVERPRAELTFSYLFGSGVNEESLGFIASPSGSIPALANLTDERNYYLLANLDNQDSVGYAGTNNRLLSMGNGVISHYGFSAAVGQPTTCEVTIEGLNLLVQATGSGQPLPSIWKQSGTAVTGRYTLPMAARTVSSYFEAAPSSIVLGFATGCAMGMALSGATACPVDSFSFSIDIPRAEVKDLGWAYPGSRPVQWPVTLGIHATAHLNAFQLDSLNRYGCPDNGHDFTIQFKSTCTVLDDMSFQFVGAKLESETIAAAVGGGPTAVQFNWSLKIADINRVGTGSPNFYINQTGAIYTSIVFPQVDYVSGSAPLTFNLSTGCYLVVLSGPGILSGNSVFVTDEASTVVVRAAAAGGGADTTDLTVTVS